MRFGSVEFTLTGICGVLCLAALGASAQNHSSYETDLENSKANTSLIVADIRPKLFGDLQHSELQTYNQIQFSVSSEDRIMNAYATNKLQLGIAELFADGNQFLHQLAKTTVFGDLCPGTIYRRSLGDDLGDGLSRAGMSQRVGGAMSRGVFLCTVAFKLKVEVYHLAKPSALTPSRQTYVVWTQARGKDPQNQGVLKVNDKLEGTFEDTVSNQDFDLFVTAEDSPTVQAPSEPKLLKGSMQP